ncbi:MAG: hypothetical protein R3F43_17815 [bacterium]
MKKGGTVTGWGGAASGQRGSSMPMTKLPPSMNTQSMVPTVGSQQAEQAGVDAGVLGVGLWNHVVAGGERGADEEPGGQPVR